LIEVLRFAQFAARSYLRGFPVICTRHANVYLRMTNIDTVTPATFVPIGR
jgi:hypothetical protein